MDVHHNLIGDEGMKALMGRWPWRPLAKLTSLNVAENVCSEQGVEEVADAIGEGRLPSLRTLYVDCEYMKNKKLQEACDTPKRPGQRGPVHLRGFGGG